MKPTLHRVSSLALSSLLPFSVAVAGSPLSSTAAQCEGTQISALPCFINACGRYYLSSCLTGMPNQPGISINADNVTVDLNGFSLNGVANSLDGIVVVGAHANI